MLEGRNVNLKVIDKDDMDFELGLVNDMDLWGEYNGVEEQISKSEWMKHENLTICSMLQIWNLTNRR